jgi:hypothetical protein
VNIEAKTIPCKTCGKPTSMLGTKLCDPCWEVEHRLRDYLRGEGGKAFVRAALMEAQLTMEQRVLLVSGGSTDLAHRAAACLTEIVGTCREHGFCLAHEDSQGAFVLEPRTDERHASTGQSMNAVNEQWLLSATVVGLSLDEDMAARTERLEASK